MGELETRRSVDRTLSTTVPSFWVFTPLSAEVSPVVEGMRGEAGLLRVELSRPLSDQARGCVEVADSRKTGEISWFCCEVSQ